MRRHAQRGQTGTEYMLVVSVAVLAIVLAGYGFVPSFRSGVNRVGADVERMLSTGQRLRRTAPSGDPGFRLPSNAGCAGSTACNPNPPTERLGAPPDVCRRDRGNSC